MSVYELANWRSGKQTRRGEPAPTQPELVTVIPTRQARRFFGAYDDRELRRHLEGLRADGLLIHEPGRLAQRVRGQPGRCYVVRGPRADVPRQRRRPRVRVFTA